MIGGDESWVDPIISQIHRSFSWLKRWLESGARNNNFNFEIQTESQVGIASPVSILRAGMNNLPAIPCIIHFCASLWEPLDVRSILVLLSKFPNLRSATIVLCSPTLGSNSGDGQGETQGGIEILTQRDHLDGRMGRHKHASYPESRDGVYLDLH
jgi:hypothetical protein